MDRSEVEGYIAQNPGRRTKIKLRDGQIRTIATVSRYEIESFTFLDIRGALNSPKYLDILEIWVE